MRLTCLLSALSIGVLAAAGADAQAHTFTVTPSTLRADELGQWRASLTLENKGQWGLYADSLAMDWVNADPDSSDRPRHETRPMGVLVSLMQPASAGESTGIEWTAPADFERGMLVFRVVAHDAQKTVFHLSTTVQVVGSDLSDLHPPVLLSLGQNRVEMVVLDADSSVRPAPAVLYVPPSGTSARSLMRWAMPYMLRGNTMAIVSLPGSGRSTGSPDHAGPASVAAVNAALERLLHQPSVDPKRVVVWGQDEGAASALLAAVSHPELAGVIAMDTDFDPWATYRALPDSARAGYVRAAGRDSAGWRARSPLAVATRIAAPVLVLQSLESRVPVAPAQAFAAARAEKKLFIEARLSATEPKPFHHRDAVRVALDFLARRTHRP